jgi:hypothetical protein
LTTRVLAIALLLASSAPSASAECGPPMSFSCSLKDLGDVIFVGTLVSEKNGAYHFNVEEPFKGVKAATMDVVRSSGEGGTGFNGTGKRYLVFARSLIGDRTYYVGGCGNQMVEPSHAGPWLEQLRRMAHGRRAASLFGRLTRHENPFESLSEEPPVPDVTVRLKSPHRTYSGRTKADGSYAIEDVAAGTYDLEADLPDGFEIGRINYYDAEPLEIEKHACQETNVEAMPGGLISGRVIGPDGKPREDVRVDLYRPDFLYIEYLIGWVKEGARYTFPHLLPGDYTMVFGALKGIDPDNPFPRTFYRDSPDFEHSTVIHLAAGQRVLDADIHLPQPFPMRQITVTIDWNGQPRADFWGNNITVSEAPSGGTASPPASADGSLVPFPRRSGPDRFRLNLLLDRSYAIRADVSCKNLHRPAEGESVRVDGADASVTEVTVRVAPHACDGP